MFRTLAPHTIFYQELADAIPQPVVIVDRDFVMIICNESFNQLASASQAELTGRDFFSVSSTGEHDGEVRSNIERSIKYNKEFAYSHPADLSRKFMLSVRNLKSPSSSMVLRVISFREITLEIESQQRRDDFISIASHELKSPIAIISAYSQIIEKEARKSTYPVISIYASKINQQSKKLISLSSTLLDISEIQTGRLTLKKSIFSLNELISELVENFSYTHTSHAMETDIPGDILLYADKQKITQVLNNLISNGIKYSPTADRLKISCTINHERVEISVIDFGMGIPPEEQGKLFRRFSRTARANGENIPGSGLGLYICHEIVRLHDGQLGVESEPGKGSRFFFSLPVHTA